MSVLRARSYGSACFVVMRIFVSRKGFVTDEAEDGEGQTSSS